jgi:photosystem II stability/assembly factor-like uncharacterized protein
VLVFAVSGSTVAGQAAAAAFEPFRASFVSPTTGFVLGTTGCPLTLTSVAAAQPVCRPVLESTSDAGAHWAALGVPATTIGVNRSDITKVGGHIVVAPYIAAVTFADARNGWLYGPALWATHDGGRDWTRVAVDDVVSGVTVAGGWVYATLVGITADSDRYPLLRSPVGSNDWQTVGAVTGRGSGGDTPMAAFGATLWATTVQSTDGSSDVELWRSADGTSWQALGYPCGRQGYVANMAAASATDLVIECGYGGVVMTSTDGGAHLEPAPGPLGEGGWLGPMAVGVGAPDVLVFAQPSSLQGVASTGPSTRAPRSSIVRTTDGGHTLTPTTYHDHGAGFVDLQFVGPSDGWVVHGYPGGPADQLLRTTDAGATFAPVAP